MISELQRELDDLLQHIKDVNTEDDSLKKLHPDLYMTMLHILEKKDLFARNGLSESKERLLSLSLEQFNSEDE